jgi:hypothetical protein
MCSGFWKMGTKQHVKWSFLLAVKNSTIDALNEQVVVNFFLWNFQDVMWRANRAYVITQKWYWGYLKIWHILGWSPYFKIDKILVQDRSVCVRPSVCTYTRDLL